MTRALQLPGRVVAAALALWISPAPAAADAKSAENNRWAQIDAPLSGPALSIGGYSAGCLRGGVALPLRGDGFQVARPSRNRHYGHPDLVGLVSALGAVAAEGGWTLLVGDLGQPRGGPAPSGHSSHQTGLDADVWFWSPPPRRLRAKRGDWGEPPAIVNRRGLPTRTWNDRIVPVLRRAATDPLVSRLFVHPGIKKKLCESSEDRTWLRKVRPWFGHRSHFHVRMSCPASSPDCVPQKPLPEGDGCEDLDWWLDEKAQKERAQERAVYRGRVSSIPELPAACGIVLDD